MWERLKTRVLIEKSGAVRIQQTKSSFKKFDAGLILTSLFCNTRLSADGFESPVG